jgi:hypothetical protein
VALDVTQKEELAALLAQEHVGVLVTPGDRWPTANLQAFAETPELETLFIMAATQRSFKTSRNIREPPCWWTTATSARSRPSISRARGFKDSRARLRREA